MTIMDKFAARWLLSVLVAVTAASTHAGQNDNYPFAVETEKTGDGHRIVAKNRGPAPISVRVSLVDNKNIAPDRPFPIFAVVPPGGGTLFLAHIRPAVPMYSSSFSFQSSWMLGDFNARQSPDAVYRLPYKEGAAYPVGQAPGGPITTHTHIQSANAVDIGMPQGAPVLAARDGTVIYAEANQIYGGNNPDLMAKANEVRIQHIDGTVAIYAHLAYGGVHAYLGQRVKAGDQIGLAGSTGYSSGPHLHFAIQTIIRDGDELITTSLPFKFFVGNPVGPVNVFRPQYGLLVTANYTTAPVPAATVRAAAAVPRQRNVPAGAPEMSISFVIPEPVRLFFVGIPAWTWVALMAVVVAIIIAAQKRDDAERRRRQLHFVREPTIRSRPIDGNSLD
ncbi:MAG: M23 family metallopeptidase [Sulfuritalea sp.]|nr:M23 family metallopeptidase [Sulfuritalea sp.]